MTHEPDDEALSAHLDGEGDDATAEHLEACATCQARLEELRAAANAVATPVPAVSQDARGAAVAAAVTSGGVGIARRRPVPTWVAAAAAAVVLALAAIPVVASLRDGGEERDAALHGQGTADDAATGEFAAGPDDLGTQSDPAALRRLLEERLRAPVALAPSAAAQAESDGGGDSAEAGGGGAGGAAPSQPCEAEARAAGAGRVGLMLLVAVLQWETQPAIVYVFEAPDAEAAKLSRRAFVMARRDCQLLVAQSF